MRLIALACLLVAAPLVVTAFHYHEPVFLWAALALAAAPVVIKAYRRVRAQGRAEATGLEARFQELRIQHPEESERELRAQAKLELWSKAHTGREWFE